MRLAWRSYSDDSVYSGEFDYLSDIGVIDYFMLLDNISRGGVLESSDLGTISRTDYYI
jgi:hypothetical protein